MVFGLCFQTASAVFFVDQAADVARLPLAVFAVGGLFGRQGFDGLVAVHEFHPLPVAPAAVFAAGNPFADGVRADAAVTDFAFGKFFFLFAVQVIDVLTHLCLAQRLLAEAGEGGVGAQVFQ